MARDKMNTLQHSKSADRPARLLWFISILAFSTQLFGAEIASAPNPASKEAAARSALGGGERSPASNARNMEAQARFVEVERFARLPEEQQAKEFAEFYRKLAPYYMSPMIEMILSSYPADILDSRFGAPPDANPYARYDGQLAAVAAALTPEEVAARLESRLRLDLAGRARTRRLMERHRDRLPGLIHEDLAARDLAGTQRACTMITDLQLRQFTPNLLDLYLSDTPHATAARTALVWLRDPVIVRRLLQEIAKEPKSLERHAGLFQGPLAGGPAEADLIKLLDSPDANMRYHAAYALYECIDPALAGPTAKLAREKEGRLQGAALQLAMRLPGKAFAAARPALAPLIESPDIGIRLQAITCFAKRKDLLAGPLILGFLQQPLIDPGHAVTVMQALGALTGSTFQYNMHKWGPEANAKAIARFEAWLATHPTVL
jgi:hypothetical protein